MATAGSPKHELETRVAKFIADRKHTLDLSDLGLTEIPTPQVLFPHDSTPLARLRVLDISHNRIRHIPSWITRCVALQVFIASNNRIQELPEVIADVRTLELLDLRNNKLWRLPHSMRQLASLRSLYLHNNLLDLPPEVLGGEPPSALSDRLLALASPTHPAWSISLKDDVTLETLLHVKGKIPSDKFNKLITYGLRSHFLHQAPEKRDPADILSYYFRVSVGRRPLNEAKLILVGFGAVGKTSLVKRLVYNAFDKSEKKTEGIQITQWPIKLNTNEDVRLHLWDFGGQEIMHATHQFFLTSRSLYLLVLSGRQGREDADAEYWLNLTEGLCGQSPVIVVLNKVGEHPFTVNKNGLLMKFPQIKAFVETDCQDNIGIEKLRGKIFSAIDGLEHLRDSFPSAWFDIKNRIAGMEENYLTFVQFSKICDQLGENDNKAQEELATHLHSLGIALNYKDDPRLRDTHVLNPHWVTNGIYALLNASGIASRKGEVLPGDLKDVLESGDYPEDRHAFLIGLMRKFELCFPFEGGERYLIPELLDKDQPSKAKEMEETSALRFQYRYEGAIPEGLIPRFIVRTHYR